MNYQHSGSGYETYTTEQLEEMLNRFRKDREYERSKLDVEKPGLNHSITTSAVITLTQQILGIEGLLRNRKYIVSCRTAAEVLEHMPAATSVMVWAMVSASAGIFVRGNKRELTKFLRSLEPDERCNAEYDTETRSLNITGISETGI